MPARKPLVFGSDGRPQQIQPGDSLNATITETETQQWTNGDVTSHSLGTVVYLNSADSVKKAQANASAPKEAIAFAISTISNGAVGSYQTSGTLAGLTGLTAGGIYFLDPATAGAMTTTVPSTAGQYIVELGIAISTTEFLIRIRQPVML